MPRGRGRKRSSKDINDNDINCLPPNKRLKPNKKSKNDITKNKIEKLISTFAKKIKYHANEIKKLDHQKIEFEILLKKSDDMDPKETKLKLNEILKVNILSLLCIYSYMMINI